MIRPIIFLLNFGSLAFDIAKKSKKVNVMNSVSDKKYTGDSSNEQRIFNFIDKWDYRDEANPFYEEVVTREASRAKWRHYYKAKLVYDLRQIQVQTGC